MVNCGLLNVTTSAPGGLTLEVTSTTAGARAVYSCRSSNYQLVGRAERMCGANGVWTGEEPQCQC